MTPGAGVIAGVTSTFMVMFWLPFPSYGSILSFAAAALVASDAAAIVLLGPGAFSVEARLFGRREIIIPQGSVPRME
jgi:hypothetical protein